MEASTKKVPRNTMPLYRIDHEGADHLSDAELVSIVIGTGVSEEKAMYMSHNVLREFGLSKIGSASIGELCNIPDITKLKASIISAVFELSKRHASTRNDESIKINNPATAFEYLHPLLRDEKVEHFVVLLLDTKNKLIKSVTTSTGSLNANIVHPREVYKAAIVNNAASIIVAHNHPSGNPNPSQNDIDITRKLREVGLITGIEFLDHVIIGNSKYVSLKEKNLI